MAVAGAGPLTVDQRNQLVATFQWASFSAGHTSSIFKNLGKINDIDLLAANGEIAEGITGTIGEVSLPSETWAGVHNPEHRGDCIGTFY